MEGEASYIKLCFGFSQPVGVCTVHQENDAVDCREVVFPHSAGYKTQGTFDDRFISKDTANN